MAKKSGDFERFLYANYPDDYRHATVDDVPDDVLTAIISRHEKHYKIWYSVPEWIKNEYHDCLPMDVLNGNQNVKDFVEKEEKKFNAEEKESKELLNFSVTLLALGYAAETVTTLTENRSKRLELLKQADGGVLPPKLLKKWLATRESDKRAVTADWRENQPEKYIVHLIKDLDRTGKKLHSAETSVEKAALEMRIAAAEREIRTCMAELKNKESREMKMAATEQEAHAYMTKFKNKESRDRLTAYLRQKPQQAAMRHLSPEMMDKFTTLLCEQGIQVSPARDKIGEQSMENGRDSLADNLKKNFERRLKKESLLKKKYEYQNRTFTRAGAKDVLAHEKDAGLDKIIAMRREIQEQRRA